MTRPISAKKRQEAITLRVEQQLSAPEIARRVGISNYSAYKYLKRYPWSAKTGMRRTWTFSEEATLRRLYPTADEHEISAAIPRHKFVNICKKASAMGLRRPMPGTRKNKRFVHPLFARLRQIREQRKMTRPQLSDITGFHVNELLAWELGKTNPKFFAVCIWAQGLGMELNLGPILKSVSHSQIEPPSKARLMGGRA